VDGEFGLSLRPCRDVPDPGSSARLALLGDHIVVLFQLYISFAVVVADFVLVINVPIAES